MSTATTSSPTAGSQGTFEYRDPQSGAVKTVDWSQATVQQIQQTAGWKPWLTDLGSPSKLTGAQRLACGIDAPFTCNAGDSKRRKKCQGALNAAMTQAREKCEQWAALPPPPVLVPPEPTNPQADPGALAASTDQQLAAMTYDPGYALPGGGALELPLESFVPGYAIDRGQEIGGPEPEASPGLFGLPTWAVVLVGLGIAWAVTR